MKKKLSFLKRPRWRHGGFSVVVMALVLAAFVLVNMGVSALETKYAWRKDYSFNALTTQSETTKEVMASLPYPVHIYALYTAGNEDLSLMELLGRYQAGSSNITYEMLELSSNPGLLNRFEGDADESLTADSLIVYCETTGRYKILAPTSFVSLGYNVENGGYEIAGITYEKQITEALLYVTRDKIPEILLLTGHNELEGEDVSLLKDVLESNNYAVRSFSLREGETLSSEALMMILSPQKDLSEDELNQLLAFAKAGGSFFITCDFTDPVSDMPNYLTLLRSYGITPLSGIVVASTEEAGSYYSNMPIYLTPHLLSTEYTASLVESGLDYLILAGARAFETPASADNSLTVTPIIASGYKSYLRDIQGENSSIVQQDEDPLGPFALSLFSRRIQEDGTPSSAFVLGNSTLLIDNQFYAITHNLEFLLQMTGNLINQQPVSLDIVAKTSIRPGLPPQSQPIGAAIVVAVPLLVFILALAVLMPRRHL